MGSEVSQSYVGMESISVIDTRTQSSLNIGLVSWYQYHWSIVNILRFESLTDHRHHEIIVSLDAYIPLSSTLCAKTYS